MQKLVQIQATYQLENFNIAQKATELMIAKQVEQNRKAR